MTPKEMSAVFAEWNKGELNSFLIEITRDILGSFLTRWEDNDNDNDSNNDNGDTDDSQSRFSCYFETDITSLLFSS